VKLRGVHHVGLTVSDIERAADAVVWCCDEAPGFTPGRPQDRAFVGNIVAAIEAYGTGALGETTIPLAEIDRIATSTQFNGVAILTGGSTALSLQIGANSNNSLVNDNVISLNITPGGSFYASVLSPTMTDMGVTSQSVANLAISTLDAAINAVSTARTSVGSMQSRLESASRSIAVASENAAAANSRIADADIASSMSELVRAQILQQAGISVLAQANQAPSLVLQLLK